MTALYALLTVMCFAGAIALLWLDRRRTVPQNAARKKWADEHQFEYSASGADLMAKWTRGAFEQEPERFSDVAHGTYYGDDAYIFDSQHQGTVVALRRSGASGVMIDVRVDDELAPTDGAIELVGAMGRRVMFSNNLQAARRVCDRRMIALATHAPEYVRILWNEGEWVLGLLEEDADDSQIDVGLDTVRRFTDLLRVLPPSTRSRVAAMQGRRATPQHVGSLAYRGDHSR